MSVVELRFMLDAERQRAERLAADIIAVHTRANRLEAALREIYERISPVKPAASFDEVWAAMFDALVIAHDALKPIRMTGLAEGMPDHGSGSVEIPGAECGQRVHGGEVWWCSRERGHSGSHRLRSISAPVSESERAERRAFLANAEFKPGSANGLEPKE